MTRRRKTAVWSMAFGYAGVFISLARNIALVPLYLHFITLREYGAWLATGGALALLLISDFGLAGVVMQRVSAQFGAGNIKQLGALCGSSLLVGLLLSLLLTAASLCFAPFLPAIDGLTDNERVRVFNCFLVAVGANAGGVLTSTAAAILRSLQRPVLAGSMMLFGDLLNIAFTVVGLYEGLGLYAIALGFAVRSAVGLLGMVASAAFICARHLSISLSFEWGQARRLAVDSSKFFVSAIAMRAQTQANTFFVGAMLGPESAAIYGLTVRAHETVSLLIGQINAALVPSTAHLIGFGDFSRFRQMLLRLLPVLTLITATGMAVTVSINPSFLHLWVGGPVFAGQPVSALMAFALVVASAGYVAYDALLAQGDFAFISRTYLVTTVLHILLLVALLRFGLWAAPAATLIASATWGGMFWRKIAGDIGLRGEELKTMAKDFLLIVVTSALVLMAYALQYPAPRTWSGMFLEGACSAATLLAIVFLASQNIRRLTIEEIGTTYRSVVAK